MLKRFFFFIKIQIFSLLTQARSLPKVDVEPMNLIASKDLSWKLVHEPRQQPLLDRLKSIAIS